MSEHRTYKRFLDSEEIEDVPPDTLRRARRKFQEIKNISHDRRSNDETNRDNVIDDGLMSDVQQSLCIEIEIIYENTGPTRPISCIENSDRLDTYTASEHEEKTFCSSQVCLGSIMSTSSHGTHVRRSEEILEHAEDFLNQYFNSIKRFNSEAHHRRLESIQNQLILCGTYQLTETELIFGAKLAWRNASRCIGRIQWSKLQVFDCRYVTTTSGMFEALCNHIKYSTNKGNIRSAITIFPQRSDGKHDYRVWNQQLISYAGYKNEDGTITGDAGNTEFTEICLRLGWKRTRGNFDILPLVLSANGHDPDYFDIPNELILEVPLMHPTFNWFIDLGIKWYAVPAVSNMIFDCGGLEFTAAPFNGWYMSTEIGSRDLCDVNRYNLLETIASQMGLDTRMSSSLWKDKAMVEVNVAVLYSFQLRNVTIVDHHTASDSFMKHYENEMRLRSGCPADWIWIIPPLSGSATSVFHQEMAVYYLKPSYDAQEPAWKTHIWKKRKDNNVSLKKTRRKFHFKQIARAVKFTSKLFGRALSRRIKATVLYATETGKSQMYADKLRELYSHAFHSQVLSMSDYDITNIEHEALLLVVTSTFGNGDPPENGEIFAQSLYAMKISDAMLNSESKISLSASKSFIKMNSQFGIGKPQDITRLNSRHESFADIQNEDTFGPLSNVRFAVFALGSSAYPNYCAFGRYVDNLLGELGGERLLSLSEGDEMCGQEQTFREWAVNVFNVSCDTFCLDDDDILLDAVESLGTEVISPATARLVKAEEQTIIKALEKSHNKDVNIYKLRKRTHLNQNQLTGETTLLLELNNLNREIQYNPGDHLGIFACNQSYIVNGILQRLGNTIDADVSVELQLQKLAHTPTGITKTWVPRDKYQGQSLRNLFTRFFDITTPPTPNLLRYFASVAYRPCEQKKLYLLANDSVAYEDWRHFSYPNLLEVLEEFPSVLPYAPVLLLHLNPLQPRFYSISSSPLMHKNDIHLTVAVVQYKTKGERGPVHYGVCSNYLKDLSYNDIVYAFIRSSPSFYMPLDSSSPMILVGPGTGIAPFRGFWYHRKAEMDLFKQLHFGKIWLFFGCRQKELDLYRDEKNEMIQKQVLSKEFLALSREPGVERTYVQYWIQQEAQHIYNMLVYEKGHFYVCGDCTMAEDVYQTLKQIIQINGKMLDQEVEKFMLSLRDENRFHEDIFGITLRTAEVHNRSRESALIKLAAKPNLDR